MAIPKQMFTQKEATGFLAAARKSGYEAATIVLHPDGRREFKAQRAEVGRLDDADHPVNTFDVLLNDGQ